MIEIKKTYKNYVGGKYVRSESGKTFTLNLKNDSFEVPLTSKKDIRDAVTSSKAGFEKWSEISPYTKTQILYRLSEMIEGNKDSYVDLLVLCGSTKNQAKKDVETTIENIVWYAGLADKWEQVSGNLNPVNGEYFNISHQNPIGVVFSLNSNNNSLTSLLNSIIQPLTVGCSVISFSEESSIIALKFAEDINNSDFPPGSLNILSGQFENVFEDVSKHVEINLISICKEIPNEMLKKIQENASSSVKRIVNIPSIDGISSILPFLETKTVWHPKGT
jgi:acyl-CoA reductase-like NAD-dependent aldehyde dehydrogenase